MARQSLRLRTDLVEESRRRGNRHRCITLGGPRNEKSSVFLRSPLPFQRLTTLRQCIVFFLAWPTEILPPLLRGPRTGSESFPVKSPKLGQSNETTIDCRSKRSLVPDPYPGSQRGVDSV